MENKNKNPEMEFLKSMIQMNGELINRQKEIIIEREIKAECLNCGVSLHKEIMNKEIHIHLCNKCRLERLKNIK